MTTLYTTLVDKIEASAHDIRCSLESNDIKDIDNNLFPELIELLGYVFSNLENRTTLRILRNKGKPHNSFDYNLITALNFLADNNIHFSGFAKTGKHTRKTAYVSTEIVSECNYEERQTSDGKYCHDISFQSEYPLSIYCTYHDLKNFDTRAQFVDAAKSGKLRFSDTPIPEKAKKRRAMDTTVSPVSLPHQTTTETPYTGHPTCEADISIPTQALNHQISGEVGSSLYVPGADFLLPNPDLFCFFTEPIPTSEPSEEWDLHFIAEDSSHDFLRESTPPPDPTPPPPPVVKQPSEDEMKLVTLQWLDQWMAGGTWAIKGQFVYYFQGSRLWKYADNDEFELVTDVDLGEMDEMISRPDYFELPQVKIIFSVSP